MYKVCNQLIEQVGPTISISQQWQITQRENRGNENMTDNTITDLQLKKKKNLDIYFNSLYCVSLLENTKVECDYIYYFWIFLHINGNMGRFESSLVVRRM